jgi:hypothetical protein
VLLLIAAALAFPPGAPGIGFETEATVGNLGFGEDRDSDDTDLGSDTYPWNGTVSIWGTVLDGFLLRGTYARDSIIRNTVAVTLGYEGQIMRVAAGPFVGFILDSDNPGRIKPGVSAALRAELWQFGFASFASDATLDPQLEEGEDDFRQFRVNASAGFYLPGIITSAEFDRSTLYRSEDDGNSRSRKTKYALQTEVFQKAIPYRILLEFAYRNELREFAGGGTHALGAIVFTPGVTYAPTPAFTLKAALQNGVYLFGREDILGEVESDQYFFRATLGVAFSTGG